jgi:autotransporter-associated beta strand protein
MKPKNKTLHHLGFIALAFAGFAASSAQADTALTTGHTTIDTTGDPALGVISRSTGATALFDNNGVATATGTPLPNGILGPWAFIGTGTATRYATLDGSDNVVSFTGTATTWGGTVNSATTNYEISASGTATYGGSQRMANTIRYIGGSGTTVTLGNSANGAGLTANGVLNAGTGSILFNTTGSGTAGFVIGSNAALVLNAANADITISARIHNTGTTTGVLGTTASAVTIVGPNTVTLSGASTYTGGTFVNQGTLRVGNNAGLGAGTVNIASGATVNNSAALTALANTFTGSGAFTTVAGAGQVTLTGNWSGFSGTVSSSATGDLVFNGGSTAGVANTTSASAAYVNNYTGANSNGMIVQNQTGGTVTYKLGSYASAVGSNLRSSGTATGDVNFEIGNLNTSTTAAGTIGGGAQTTSLTKVGLGTLTLSGANTYTGATTISGGTLALGSAGSIDNTSGVSLGTAGTFDVSAKGVGGYTVNNLIGSGNVTGALTVSTQLAIGNSPGTVNFSSSLTLGSGSTSIFELTGGSNTGDLGDIAGDLSITAGAILDLVQLGTYTANDKFTLFAYDGMLAGNFSGLADDSVFNDAGGSWLINYNDTTAGLNGGVGTSYVTVIAVPEPGAALLGGFGVLALLRRRRN